MRACFVIFVKRIRQKYFSYLFGLNILMFYIGTQSDFHTHVNDLPPQMGGCYESGDDYQLQCKNR